MTKHVQKTTELASKTEDSARGKHTDGLRVKASRLGRLSISAPRSSDPSGAEYSVRESRSYQKIVQSMEDEDVSGFWAGLLQFIQKASAWLGRLYLPSVKINARVIWDIFKGICVSLTVAWLAAGLGYVLWSGESYDVPALGGVIAILFLPPILLWMMIGAFARPQHMSATPRVSQAATQDLASLSTMTDAHVNTLAALSQKNAQTVQQTMAALKAQIDQMDAMSKAIQGRAHTIVQGVESGAHKLNQSYAIFQNGTDNIDRRFEARSQALLSLSETLADHVEALDKTGRDVQGAVDRMAESSESLRDVQTLMRDVQKSIVDIKGLKTQVVDPLRDMNVQLSRALDMALGGHDDIDDAFNSRIESLDDARQKAVSAASVIRGLLDHQVQALVGLSAKLSGQRQHLDMQLEQQKKAWVDHSQNSFDTLDKLRMALNDEAMNLTVVVEEAGEGLSSLRHDVREAHQAVQQGTAGVVRHFETIRETLLDVPDTLDGIAGQVDDVQKALHGLKAASRDTSTLLDTSLKSFAMVGETMEAATVQMHDKVKRISETLDGFGTDIDLLTDKAVTRAEQVCEVFEARMQGVTGYTEQFVGQMQDVGHEFIKRAGILQNEGDLVVQKIGDAGKAALEISKSLAQSKSYGESLGDRLNDVSVQTAHTVKRMGNALHVFTGSLEKAGTMSDDITTKIERASQNLKTESDSLMGVSTAALEASYEATMTFKKQSEALFRASRKAEKMMKQVETVSSGEGGGTALSASRFALEGLYSLSVDLVRMYQGGVSKQDWASYQKGDMVVFARLMVDYLSDDDLDEIREKLRKDRDFCEAVDQFMAQFETLCDQAVGQDYGGILEATLASSEVGKLYYVLCEIAEHTPKRLRVA